MMAPTLIVPSAFAADIWNERDGRGDREDDRKDKRPRRTVDMIPYFRPAQSYDDARQFHLEGYFIDTRPGQPPKTYGGFIKTARVNRPDGLLEVILQKSPGVPTEHAIMRTFDTDGKAIQIMYHVKEGMLWDYPDNWRTYDPGTATRAGAFEWARSDALKTDINIQSAMKCQWRFCDSSKDYDEDIDPAFYTVHGPFYLEDNVAAYNKSLGTLGPLYPETKQCVYDAGLSNPSVLLIAGHWCAIDKKRPLNQSNVWHREMYGYLGGERDVRIDGEMTKETVSLGLYYWAWQLRERNDPKAPFFTERAGILDKLVWENTPILPRMMCDRQYPDGLTTLSAETPDTSDIVNPRLFSEIGLNRRR